MAKKKSNKKLYIGIGIIVVLLFAGLAGAKQAGIIGQKPTKKVEFALAKKTTIIEKVNASGKIQPVDEVKISPEVSGEIVEMYVKEGDSVKNGQLLAQLRPDNFQSVVDLNMATLNTQRANLARSKAQMAQTQAQFARLEAEYNRNKKLFDDEVISQQEWDLAKANFQAAEADVEAAKQNVEAARYTVLSAEASVANARENLRLTRIFAPMNGLVTQLNVEKGESVVGTSQMQGTEILRIANLNNMEVRVNVNENDIIRVGIGDTAVIDVDSYSYTGTKFKGIVSSIANSANAATGTDVVTEFEVKILVLNESYKELEREITSASPFRPGMTASVDIITERRENVLSVPLVAVTTRAESDKTKGDEAGEKPASSAKTSELKEVVFLSKDGKAVMVEVKTGISDFDNIQIISGVEEGQQVIKGPFLMVSKTLKDGDEVEELSKESFPGRG